MKGNAWRIILGVVLVLLGALALLQNYGGYRFEGTGWGLAFGVIFGAVGAGFLVSLFSDRKNNWWAVIPGFTLIGLALLIILGALNFEPDEVLPAIFLGSIGASFLFIYVNDRVKWWALIPGGVLASLAVMLLFEQSGTWVPVVLFCGMAVTFGLVAVLVSPGEKSRAWAWWPAGACAVLALIIASTAGPLPGLVWPIVLIGAGLVMVAWTLVAKRK